MKETSKTTTIDVSHTGELKEYPVYSHKMIMEVLSGLMISMFASNIASTIVTNALPVISSNLGSSQHEYTWIVTSTLLASTATTPIWGKLADMFNKRKLLLAGLVIFIAASTAAGFSPNTGFLIGFRAVQGVGLGAMISLTQAIIGSIIPPKSRGKYMAYTGAVMAVSTVAGPLVGGFIVDVPWMGWRWCFWIVVPLSLIAWVVLWFKLEVPFFKRANRKVDVAGSALLVVAVSSLLICISFAGTEFALVSWESVGLIGITLLATAGFIVVEHYAENPIIPLAIVSMRTTALAIVASIAVGVGMFGSGIFVGQYFQLGRGYSATDAGLMMLPMSMGVLISSTLVGRLVSRHGIWKPYTLVGSAVMIVGFGLMGTVDHATPIWAICLYGLIAGTGVGSAMQNLVLAVQNSVSVHDVGAASGAVVFFRNLGGAVGVQVLGALFAMQVAANTRTNLVRAGMPPSVVQSGSGMKLDITQLPNPIQGAVRLAYADSMGPIFWVSAGMAVLSTIAIVFMASTRLRETMEIVLEEGAQELAQA